MSTTNLTQRITENSTLLLILAVILFFLNSLFAVDAAAPANGIILGNVASGTENLLYLDDMGQMFSFLRALLISFYTFFAALSFAAVCFDENKNIYFRVVSVAALMLIMFGGLGIF
ncbi:MAG: hypothetical protein HeimC3_38520 [Candidatus Heimdallarchaeota archaeon LC_3]|nr:MAG: hypothetical protein HeimC3_38520 [Candidatus Heimdallarchaeota archaeon LC_3]